MAQRAIRTTLPDGRTALNNIIDKYTGESIQLVKVDALPDGVSADGIIYFETNTSEHGTEYYKRSFGSAVNVKWFGAKGDGLTDDTAALNYALTQFSSIQFEPGKTYLVTGQIGVVRDNIEWRGNGSTILLSNESASVIDIAGDGIKVDQLHINGSDLAQRGYYVRGKNISITGCEIYGILGRTSSSAGIRVGNRVGEDLSNVVINDNYIHDINAPLDGTNGAGYGASRGIQIDSDTSITDRGVFVQSNRIEDIIAREGDGIQLIFNGGQSVYEKTPSIISDNYIKNCTRRYVKIQASNISINDNICENTLLDEDLPNAINGIGVIWGQDVNVYNNKLDCELYAYGISVSGNPLAPTPNINIYNNSIKSGAKSAGQWSKSTYQRGIRIEDSTKIRVFSNALTGNGKIEFANTSDSIISSNIVTASPGDSLTTGVISIDSSCSNVQILDNTGHGDPTSNPIMFINMFGQGCLIRGNRANYGDTNYSLVRFDSGASGSVVGQNYSETPSFNLVAGPGISQNYIEFSNRGGSINGMAKNIYYLNSIPTSGNWNSGDIIIGPYSQSDTNLTRNIGWICVTGTTSNDGGVWAPFGLTNILTGPQEPNGVRNAPIGAIYLRRPDTATAETAMYVKTVHNGNTGWKSLTQIATVSETGLVLKSAASADTAVAAPASYDQSQVQSIVDELRDLKAKMRAAGLLDT